MYVVCYLIANDIHPEDSEIKVSGVFEDKVKAEEWVEELSGLRYDAKVYKTNYYPK